MIGVAAVNQFLYLLPIFRPYNGFMAVLYDLPILAGDGVHSAGAIPFCVSANQMCALIKKDSAGYG